MSRHHGLDRVIEYGTKPLPEGTVIVNPAWRKLDQQVRRTPAQLVQRQAQFGGLKLPGEAGAQAVALDEEQKGKPLEQIRQIQEQLEQLQSHRRQTRRYLTLKELPEQ